MELGGVPRFGPRDLDLQPAWERAEGARELAGWRAGARVVAMGGKGKAHWIHGNDGQLHNAHGGWFLRHRSKRRLSVYVRRRFLFLPSLSSINTLPHQQKSINKRVINTHRNHYRVCIGSALMARRTSCVFAPISGQSL